MRWISIGALLLAGCGEKPSVQLQRDYDRIVALNQSPSDRCSTARKIATALYDEGDKGQSMVWRARADNDCDAMARQMLVEDK